MDGNEPAPGPLGYIIPSLRTQEQRDAGERAMAQMPRFAMTPIELPKGTKVMLTDFWKAPEVVADIGGEPFAGFGQYTGSCVGVSEGNAGTTILAVQRTIATAPTRASIIWWPFPYGRTRYNEGDRGQGEGAVVSVMGSTLVKEGFFDITEPGLPAFSKTGPDGWWLTKQQEYQWSDGAWIAQQWRDKARERSGMTKAVVGDTMGIRSAIVNGYPILNGCDNYVGNGSIVAGGGEPYVRGRYTTRGGHATCFLGTWHHPNDGYLYLYSNQWPTSTYPKDPAGGGRCCVWLPESEVEKLFRTGGDDGETFALSNAPAFPLQPEVLNWIP